MVSLKNCDDVERIRKWLCAICELTQCSVEGVIDGSISAVQM